MTRKLTALAATLILWLLAIPAFAATPDQPATTGSLTIPHMWLCEDGVDASLPCQHVPGPTYQIGSFTMPVVGEACEVTATVSNNDSIHLTDLVLETNGQSVTFPDVERSSDAVTPGSNTVTPAETGTITVVFGPDGQTALDVTLTFDCEGVPPSSTTTSTTIQIPARRLRRYNDRFDNHDNGWHHHHGDDGSTLYHQHHDDDDHEHDYLNATAHPEHDKSAAAVHYGPADHHD